MYGLRVALWGVAIGAFGLILTMNGTGSFDQVLIFLLLVLVVLCPAFGELYAARRKQRDWYVRTFTSFDELRQSVDVLPLRRIRDCEGVAEAVHELKKRYPLLPVAEAAKLVRSL